MGVPSSNWLSCGWRVGHRWRTYFRCFTGWPPHRAGCAFGQGTLALPNRSANSKLTDLFSSPWKTNDRHFDELIPGHVCAAIGAVHRQWPRWGLLTSLKRRLISPIRQVVGYIPAAVGGQKVKLAHSGSTFRVGPASLKAWSGWWRIIQIDQWGVFFIGAILGMALPAILYTSALPAGTDMRGLAVAAEQAAAMAAQGGALLTFVIALMGAWVLFKTQLEIIEGTVRAITDILWTGSTRIREWQDGDVRFVYYSVMGIGVFWGIVALSLTQPIILLQLGANMAGVVFVVSAVHVLRVNTTLLPPELRPPMWRRWRCCFCACSTASSCICGSWEESSPIPRKAPCSTSLLTWA